MTAAKKKKAAAPLLTLDDLVEQMKASPDGFSIEQYSGPLHALVFSVTFNSDAQANRDFVRLMFWLERMIAAAESAAGNRIHDLFDAIRRMTFAYGSEGNDAFNEYVKSLESEVKP